MVTQTSPHNYRIVSAIKCVPYQWMHIKYRNCLGSGTVASLVCDEFTHPSQIFFTLFFSWSPWKKMMNTDLWTWSPCWKVREITYRWLLCMCHQCLNIQICQFAGSLYAVLCLCMCYMVSFCVMCWPWWGPPEGPRSLPSLRRRCRDTPSTASSQRWESSLCWSLRPQTWTHNIQELRGEEQYSFRVD